jgi:hypothetical protein
MMQSITKNIYETILTLNKSSAAFLNIADTIAVGSEETNSQINAASEALAVITTNVDLSVKTLSETARLYYGLD